MLIKKLNVIIDLVLLEGLDLLQRRCSLEEWMTKLLSDIDLSRSFSLAAFLELEAAARSCMYLQLEFITKSFGALQRLIFFFSVLHLTMGICLTKNICSY